MIDIPALIHKAALVAQVGVDDAEAGQLLAAQSVAQALRTIGFAVELGDYAGFTSVEVLGRDGLRVLATPLHEWDPEDHDPDNGRWEFAVRGTDGGLVPRPDGDDQWGCPDIWDVVHAGLRLDQGIASLREVMHLAGDLLGWIPASPSDAPRPVRPGQPAADYAVDPYPGERPTGSWVVDRNERCWPVVPDEGMPSGWAVLSSTTTRVCLDAWLERQGAVRLADRVPVLSYGSNACPGKVLDNRTPLPAVNLGCEMEELASVWCPGTTRAGRTPVTLAAVPGHSETAVVTMASPAELARLDVIEGRRGGWYALQVLHTGRVVLENGARVLRPAAYVGTRKERRPRLVDGLPVLRVDVGHDTAALLRRAFSEDGAQPQSIGGDVPLGTYPSPGQCTPALFTYGTLMPGQVRSHLIDDQLVAEPWDARMFGDLRDTGYGYPALSAAADRKAPGVLCSFRPETMARTLTLLDRVEGTGVGLFSRQLRNVGGILSWVYLADGCAGTGTPIDAWR